MKKNGFRLLCVGICLALFSACAPRRELYTETRFDLFDTVAVVQGYAESESAWDEQADALLADLERYNALFDIYAHHDGVVNLYDVNASAADAPVAVSDELYDFLDWCKNTVYPAANGATNVAAGAVLCLWHDARESDSPAPPDDAEIAQTLQHISMDDFILDPAAHTVYFADPALKLDVGAVAKGYAVEQAAQAAEARGLTSALLNVGGDVRAIGTKADGTHWTAGVESPWDTTDYLQAIELESGDSLVVSGDYQRYFEYDGVRYAHLIDLTTGQPARYYRSVAVLTHGGTGGMADALSTALFCLAPDESAALAAQNDAAALWLYADESTVPNEAWEACS